MNCRCQQQPLVSGRFACSSVQLQHMGLLRLPQLRRGLHLRSAALSVCSKQKAGLQVSADEGQGRLQASADNGGLLSVCRWVPQATAWAAGSPSAPVQRACWTVGEAWRTCILEETALLVSSKTNPLACLTCSCACLQCLAHSSGSHCFCVCAHGTCM